MAGFADLLEALNSSKRDSSDPSNLDIIVDKFASMREALAKFAQNLTIFDSVLADQNVSSHNLQDYLINLQEGLKRYEEIDLDPISRVLDYAMLPPEYVKDVKNAHINLQESEMLQSTLKIGENIIRSRMCESTSSFIARCKDSTIAFELLEGVPVPGELRRKSDYVDLAEIWAGEYAPWKNEALVMLIAVANSSRDIFNIRKKPDFSVKKIFSSLMGVIQNAQKDLKGCSAAIKILTDSAETFEANFQRYYTSTISSGSMFSIIDEYTTDIIGTLADKEVPTHVISQLRQISRYFQKMIQREAKSKKMVIPDDVKAAIAKLNATLDSVLGDSTELQGTDEDLGGFNDLVANVIGRYKVE